MSSLRPRPLLHFSFFFFGKNFENIGSEGTLIIDPAFPSRRRSSGPWPQHRKGIEHPRPSHRSAPRRRPRPLRAPPFSEPPLPPRLRSAPLTAQSPRPRTRRRRRPPAHALRPSARGQTHPRVVLLPLLFAASLPERAVHSALVALCGGVGGPRGYHPPMYGGGDDDDGGAFGASGDDGVFDCDARCEFDTQYDPDVWDDGLEEDSPPNDEDVLMAFDGDETTNDIQLALYAGMAADFIEDSFNYAYGDIMAAAHPLHRIQICCGLESRIRRVRERAMYWVGLLRPRNLDEHRRVRVEGYATTMAECSWESARLSATIMSTSIEAVRTPRGGGMTQPIHCPEAASELAAERTVSRQATARAARHSARRPGKRGSASACSEGMRECDVDSNACCGEGQDVFHDAEDDVGPADAVSGGAIQQQLRSSDDVRDCAGDVCELAPSGPGNAVKATTLADYVGVNLYARVRDSSVPAGADCADDNTMLPADGATWGKFYQQPLQPHVEIRGCVGDVSEKALVPGNAVQAITLADVAGVQQHVVSGPGPNARKKALRRAERDSRKSVSSGTSFASAVGAVDPLDGRGPQN